MPANPLATRMGNSASNACNVASRQLYNQNEDDPFTHNVLCLGLTKKVSDGDEPPPTLELTLS